MALLAKIARALCANTFGLLEPYEKPFLPLRCRAGTPDLVCNIRAGCHLEEAYILEETASTSQPVP